MSIEQFGFSYYLETATMPVRDPRTGRVFAAKDGAEAYIEFWGPEADITAELRRSSSRDLVRMQEGKARKQNRGMSDAEIERLLDDLEARTKAAVIGRVKSAAFVDQKTGELIKATPDQVREVLETIGWLFDDASTFISDADNFLSKA